MSAGRPTSRALCSHRLRASFSSRAWSLAARINAYLAVDRYHRQDLASAGFAAQAAFRALRSAPVALPYVKTHALTTRAVIDLHDPDRAHLATVENVDALEIALSNGMISTARDALFNIVNFGLPSNIVLGPGFGEISRTATSSRQIQFSLKIIY